MVRRCYSLRICATGASSGPFNARSRRRCLGSWVAPSVHPGRICAVGFQPCRPFPLSPGLRWWITPQASPVAGQGLPQFQRSAFWAGVGRVDHFDSFIRFAGLGIAPQDRQQLALVGLHPSGQVGRHRRPGRVPQPSTVGLDVDSQPGQVDH